VRATELLSREEIRAFTRASDLLGLRSVAVSWGLIAAAFALVAWWPAWWTVLISVAVIGGRQLALAVLMHECSHHSLFHTRWVNDVVGRWVVGAPIWQDVHRYRTHHLRHHTHTGTDKDPDMGLVTAFPTDVPGLARKVARDLFGVAGLRRVVGLLLMDLGVLSYTASTGATRQHPTAGAVMRNAVVNLGPVVVVNVALLAVLWAFGHPMLYGLWVVAWLTTFGLFIRIRSIAEHACTERSSNMLRNTRTTRAGWVARLFVAPHDVQYHLEHHLLMTVPHYRLAELHARLTELDVFDETNSAPGYLAVLRTATAGSPR
jgi:fatty acid desaturase